MVNLEEDDSMIKFSSEKAQVNQLVSAVRIVSEKSEEQRSKLARKVARKASEVFFNCMLAYAKNNYEESEIAKKESLHKLQEYFGLKPSDKLMQEGIFGVKLKLNTKQLRDELDGPTLAYFFMSSKNVPFPYHSACFLWSVKFQHFRFVLLEEISMLLVNSWTDAFALEAYFGSLSFQEDSKVGKFMRSLGWPTELVNQSE